MSVRTVGVNDIGRRVGDSHPNAKLTDHEVDLLLSLRDEGWPYSKLATKFEISKSQARNICKGLKRCQIPARYKAVHLSR
ncbi:hypothetical protein [Rhodoferax sp.]|uniref:hypothetical protein n=1 Tax=Rhodoferax sp. TaxID=50421 RepID=UPI002ACEB940|nr:hypothetical protein [Rhodoferax sp.]MDZ7918501.1 hypothetical protein [Rhodoferax sp.]